MQLVPGKDFLDPRDRKEVTVAGTIRRPGKFEGEMYYVPYFWDRMLNGEAEDVEEPNGIVYAVLEIDDDERKAFKLSKDDFSIWMYETDQGFVNGEILSKKKDTKIRDEIATMWEQEGEQEDQG